MTSLADPAVDLAVIGAGPAGLTASITVADAGLSVVLLDMGERIGGQYWRHPEGAQPTDPSRHDWARFLSLRARFDGHVDGGRIVHRPRHIVWSLERVGSRCVVRATSGERERLPCTVHARAVIVATGAHDRHLPFPGWTLPGVMAGGGAQSLIKGSGVAAGRRAVVAGTGPFLLAVADALLGAGVEVLELVDPNVPIQMLRRPSAMVELATKLPQAIGYANHLRRRRVRISTGQAVIAAHGQDRLCSVTIAKLDRAWRVIPGTERALDCDLLTVGYGFTPQVELPLAAGCETGMGPDGSLIVSTDSAGRTSVPGIYAAGETTGVGGADLALVEGQLCGGAVIEDLRRALDHRASGGADMQGSVLPRARRGLLLMRRRSLRAFATAMHDVFSIKPGWQGWLDPETVICRCEEVTYARIREALDRLGAGDVRSVKLLARPGMGWCQGRICGAPVASLAAADREGRLTSDHEEFLAMSRRALGNPVPLSQLAALTAGLRPSEPGLGHATRPSEPGLGHVTRPSEPGADAV